MRLDRGLSNKGVQNDHILWLWKTKFLLQFFWLINQQPGYLIFREFSHTYWNIHQTTVFFAAMGRNTCIGAFSSILVYLNNWSLQLPSFWYQPSYMCNFIILRRNLRFKVVSEPQILKSFSWQFYELFERKLTKEIFFGWGLNQHTTY